MGDWAPRSRQQPAVAALCAPVCECWLVCIKIHDWGDNNEAFNDLQQTVDAENLRK